ncbi:MAG: dihydrolipoyl dehydrogenase [Monoglobales bacterium]
MLYDLIVLGGGPGGYLAAERAGHAGLKTLLIEKRAVGGVCLNEGCVPSKALLYSAKVYDYAKHGEHYGVTAENVKFDHSFAMKRKDKVVSTLVGGIKMSLKANKVTLVEGEGVIMGRDAEGFILKVGEEEYKGAKLLIATGSMPIVPPIKGVKEGAQSGMVLTNREILSIPAIPENLVIVGGGVIGLEMASYFNSVGSKVTVIEMLPKIAGATDAEISNILLKNYAEKGVEFKLGCKVVEVTDKSVVYEKDGKTESVSADKVLLSIGRRAVTQGIGLENIGVATERGAIITDRYSKTNVAGVYAAGDVNGKMMLAHVAYREAEVAINNMLGKKDIMRYDAVPSVIYTNPEVGCVGETEESAKAKGIDIEVANITMNYSGRYVAENEGGKGICKVIVDKKYKRLIGAHMIGNYASEIIFGAGIMIETEMRVDDIKEIIFPHPTVCEILREAIFQL